MEISSINNSSSINLLPTTASNQELAIAQTSSFKEPVDVAEISPEAITALQGSLSDNTAALADSLAAIASSLCE